MTAAKDAYDNNTLVTFGIVPTFPSTGYGYVKAGAASGDVFQLERFVEKPCLEKAQEYLASGEYAWNSGMFVFRPGVFVDELKKHSPEMAELSIASFENAKTDDSYDQYVDNHQVELALAENCVLGSRLAIWMLKEADLKVYLTASPEERARRIQKREGGTLEQRMRETCERDAHDSARYKRLYGIDNSDTGVADLVIDTSRIRTSTLRNRIRRSFSELSDQQLLDVSVYSFGFKHGMPVEADLMIDVRFLPNPFYDPEMRTMTGNDEKVARFVLDNDVTRKFLKAWRQLLDVAMPGYIAEGKTQLSIAVGCTGGQHRSVAIANDTAAYLKEQGYHVTLSHRDLKLANVTTG